MGWIGGDVVPINRYDNPDPESSRRKACRKQCKIQKFIEGGSIFEGNCICERPNQCWFNLQDELTDVDKTKLFADVMKYYIELASE